MWWFLKFSGFASLIILRICDLRLNIALSKGWFGAQKNVPKIKKIMGYNVKKVICLKKLYMK